MTALRIRYRIRFAKLDDLRWSSHRDMMRLWERLFRRAETPLSMSEGFHPKPRMNIPAALAVGIAGWNEVLEIELAEDWPAERLQAALQSKAPPGLEIKFVERMAEGAKKAVAERVTFETDIPAERQSQVAERIASFLSVASLPIQREGREAPLDLRPLVEDLSLVDGRLRITLRVDREGSARPREVLAALGLEDLEQHGYELARTELQLA